MVKVKFHGHAAIEIKGTGEDILIDPFITGNPQATVKAEELEPTMILVSHGHGDHLGDAVSISKRTGATVHTNFEIANYIGKKGGNAHPMHIGGGMNFSWGRVQLTNALHGSTIDEDGESIPAGNPVGFIVNIDGKTIYFAGDTGLFGDMELLGKRFDIDLAILPIGDNFTMGIDDAAYAADLLKAKKVLPIHYNTFPVIEQDPEEFAEKVGERAVILKPGEEMEI